MRRTHKKDQVFLELPLPDNQFTISELVAYLNGVYGAKVCENIFTSFDFAYWNISGNIPVAYGGHKLTSVIMSGVVIYTVDGISRDDLRYMRSLQKTDPIVHETQTKLKPRRTALYYKMARMKEPTKILPDNWRQVGIQGNQIKIKKKK